MDKRYIVEFGHHTGLSSYLNGSHNLSHSTTHLYECAAQFKTEDEALGILDAVMSDARAGGTLRATHSGWKLLEVISTVTREGDFPS